MNTNTLPSREAATPSTVRPSPSRPICGIRPAVAALVALSIATPSFGAGNADDSTTPAGEWIHGHVLVMPRPGLPDDALAKILNAHGARSLGKLGGSEIHVVALPPGASETAVVNALSRNPHLKFAELDKLVAPDLTPVDSYYGSEWHLQAVQAPAAWDLSLGQGVTIAILDTGVDATHPDLQAQLVAGWNFYDNNSNTADVYGHGTKVAGVAAAQSNNGAGVTGAAWSAKLMPIRISDPSGYASWSTIANGLYWAADHGARVANISYAAQGSATVQSAAQYLRNKGGLVINSAGNSGALDTTAASDALISVSATDSTDTRASWSSYGAYVDVAAPGVGIWTTVAGGGYGAVSGTSFSSPLTAGVVSLMMAANPALAPSQLEGILKSTAFDLGAAGYDQYYGYGRINAAAAVQSARQTQAVDAQAPAVSITSPTGGTVSGLVAVNATATDNIGVAAVDLFVNGTKVAGDGTQPYGFSWDSTSVPDGSATLVARAYDAAGNATNSASVTVRVANTTTVAAPDTTPPTVAITSPGSGAKVTGLVTIQAVGADNQSLANVSLYVDGTLVATGNKQSISAKWNTNKAAKGTHTISATATDAAGNRATMAIQVAK